MIVGIAGNVHKPEILPVLQTLLASVREVGLLPKLERRLARLARSKGIIGRRDRISALDERALAGNVELLLALGGDGTILHLARAVGSAQTPILGINVGKLGFLAAVSVSEVEECLRDVVRGAYIIEDRGMLQAMVKGSRSRFLALNDIVVEKHGTSRVVKFSTFVNDQYVATHTADGIIASTPTGSTAYSLANGGPIIHPSARVIALSPICPHTLTARPLIVTDDARVQIRVEEVPNPIQLTADGQLGTVLKTPARVVVERAPFVARLVKRLNTSYYDVLRKKLNWGSDVRLSGE
jgi:NAD+ kinase